VRHIVECFHDDARALGRAVMIAVAVSAPLKHKGGRAHGRAMVLVTTVGAVVKSFKGAPKAWSRYWPSPAFRRESSDTEARYDCLHLESSHGKERVSQKEFHTILIGPQLQALY
jgi:hypothetical protein